MKQNREYRYTQNLLDISNINRKIFFHQSASCYATKLDFILSNKGIIFVGLKHDFITKESELNKASVVMAGSIVVSFSGYVTYIDNKSGTYRFNKKEIENSINTLNQTIDLKHCFILCIQDDESKLNIHNKYFVNRDSSNLFSPEDFKKRQRVYKDNKTVPEYSTYIISGDTEERDSWIIEKNNFHAKKYISLNDDIKNNQYIGHSEDRAKNHFLEFGQYEAGRIINCF